MLLQDPEIGQQAGLASMETLDDSMGEKLEKLTNGEDGMESVKLDTEVRNVMRQQHILSFLYVYF
jgi:hypothetical protein